MNLKDNSVLLDKWQEEYGNVIRVRGLFGVRQMPLFIFTITHFNSCPKENRLFTTDTVAISHILSHIDIYEKPEISRYNVSKLIGAGLIPFHPFPPAFISEIGLFFLGILIVEGET